jgi:ATP synthase protein I
MRNPKGDKSEARLAQLQQKIRSKKQPEGKQQKAEQSGAVIASEAIAAVFTGVILGVWADKWSGWAPWLTCIGSILGFITAGANLWKRALTQTLTKTGREDKDDE